MSKNYQQLTNGDYRTAWDAALYGYWFLTEKHHNPLSRKDYLYMAKQSHLSWYARFKNNVGYLLCDTIERFVPATSDVPAAFFQNQRTLGVVG